ncbi:unnamed protein product [Urochloa humidicola]
MAAVPQLSALHQAAAICLLLAMAAAATSSTVSVHTGQFNTSCIPAERAALLSFKANITSDPTNRLGSWRGENCCLWSGVKCSNKTGHVVKLNLRNEYLPMDDDITGPVNSNGGHWLHGQISSSLLDLPRLRHLDLSGNFLGEGMPIPEFLGSLTLLKYLNLSMMGFSGSVPPQLGNLSKLVYLGINNYYYYGYTAKGSSLNYSPDLSWLARLSSLKHLSMNGVNISMVANWVHVVNTLPNLRVLSLQACSITTSVPSLSHPNLTVLEELDLSWNHLNGRLAPNWFWNLTSLKSLVVHSCGLFGSFPHELGNMTSLEVLSLGQNNLHGMVADTVKKLCNLKTLDLFSNNIGVDITYLIEMLPSCPQRNLQALNLGLANLTGSMPYWLPNLSNLRALDLSFNHISGSIPIWIGGLASLDFLNLAANNLSGIVSEEHFANLSSLTVINLSYNYLEIKLGLDWVPPFQLKAAAFTSCHMGPQFPTWLRSQKYMEDLEIQNTSLSGRIPNWFWTTFSNASFFVPFR